MPQGVPVVSALVEIIRAEAERAVRAIKRFPARVALTLVKAAATELVAQERASGESGGAAKPVIQPLGLFVRAKAGDKALRIFEDGEPGAVVLLPIGNPPAAVIAAMAEQDLVLWSGERVHFSADASGNVEVPGITVKLTDTANTGVARIGDTVQSIMPLDPVFWTWVAAVHATLGGAVWTAPPPPTTLGGEITTGSTKVEADPV